MQYLAWLAPIAFVFSLAALAQVGSLKKIKLKNSKKNYK